MAISGRFVLRVKSESVQYSRQGLTVDDLAMNRSLIWTESNVEDSVVISEPVLVQAHEKIECGKFESSSGRGSAVNGETI